MAKYKKYPPTDPIKECPLGSLHQKQCHNCRWALLRYDEKEIQQMKSTGNLEAQNEAYTCAIIALFQEIRQLNKALQNN